MYSCEGQYIAMEGHVQLWRVVYSYGGTCIAVEGNV